MNKKSRKHFARPALCSIALALSLSVSGCGLSSSVTRMGSADIGTKIYIIGQSKSIEFWEKVKQGAIEAGEELGYDVVYTSADSVTDIDGQKKLIHEAINAGAQTIVIAPNDPEKLNEDLQEAVDAGIDILTIDSDVNFDGRSAYIGTINASSGAIAARHALEYLSDYYNDKVLVVSESDSLAISDRLSGFLPALIGGVKSSAAVKYADIIAANAQAELEGATDIPESILGPARAAAAVSTANNAPEEAVARAVANAVATPAKAENIDVEVAARAAKLAVDAQGGNGDLAAKLVRELMGAPATNTDNETSEPVYNNTEEVEAKVNAAAQAAAKAAAGKGASAAEIADAAAQAAIESAIELGAGPGTAAKAAGQAAGMNGGDSIAASSAASAAVDEAARKGSGAQQGGTQQGGAPQGDAQQGAAQQGGAPEGAAQQGGPDASVEVPAELAQAAQQAAKTAAANGAPADAIAQAAAEAAASAAIEMGASPAAAGQAAGQAAGMNGGNAQLAGSTAAQTVAEALAGGEGAEGTEGGEGAQKPDDAQQGETPSTTTLPSINSINPVAGILHCKGLAENAKAEITQMLSTKDGSNIKVIFATSENSTLGACQAVSDLGLVGKVAIVGYNSSENELTYLKNGTLSGLILQNPYNMGYLGVYYAGRLKIGENVNQMVDTGATYASLNNLNSYEIKLLLDPAEFTKK